MKNETTTVSTFPFRDERVPQGYLNQLYLKSAKSRSSAKNKLPLGELISFHIIEDLAD
jgi:hypothetical protein